MEKHRMTSFEGFFLTRTSNFSPSFIEPNWCKNDMSERNKGNTDPVLYRVSAVVDYQIDKHKPGKAE
jgi:hypothetical protein